MKKIIPVVLLLLITAIGFGQWKSLAQTSNVVSPTQDVGTYSLETFRTALAEGNSVLIDTRGPEEVKEGFIRETSLFINYNDTELFTKEMEKLDKNKKYLVYCRSGNRSSQAVRAMKSMGFNNVHDLKGGILAWTNAGEELVTIQ